MSDLFTSLSEAIALIRDGDVVALEGFTHLIPFAAAHELIRQGRRNLTLVRMTPDLICDQLIGAGCAARLVFSWGGNPGVGSLHRLRDAVEQRLAACPSRSKNTRMPRWPTPTKPARATCRSRCFAAIAAISQTVNPKFRTLALSVHRSRT